MINFVFAQKINFNFATIQLFFINLKPNFINAHFLPSIINTH